MTKSLSFGVVHLGVAFGISYALTGSVTIAGAITLVEPLVNTGVHYLFDRYWEHPRPVAARQRIAAVWRRDGRRRTAVAGAGGASPGG